MEWGIFCKKNEGEAHNVRGGLIKLEPVAIFGVHDSRCHSNFSLPTHPFFRFIIHHYFPRNSFLNLLIIYILYSCLSRIMCVVMVINTYFAENEYYIDVSTECIHRGLGNAQGTKSVESRLCCRQFRAMASKQCFDLRHLALVDSLWTKTTVRILSFYSFLHI